VRFAAVASAVEAMVWESETDGNPSVDADESISPNEKLTEPEGMTQIAKSATQLTLILNVLTLPSKITLCRVVNERL
jgi:hypothetical protein